MKTRLRLLALSGSFGQFWEFKLNSFGVEVSEAQVTAAHLKFCLGQ